MGRGAPHGPMDLKQLRRGCALREAGGFLTLPIVYGALMGAGALSYEPSLAFLTLGLVFMLVMQQRSGAAAAAVAPRRGKRRGPGFPASDLEAADRRIFRQIA